ncbi:unnamed protein product [Rotaria sordida]|uniref:DUF4139 domain-containing protein n=1 Tax=Rotaria sordida TaxID=392033 RepID=A0A815E8Y5_9BILA|nr:unnamed protein product [Rotaria sordida]
MLFLSFALLYLTQSLLAVDLSIYKSFTEVRLAHSGIGDYAYEFANAEYDSIIDGSISWEGTSFARQEVYNTIESLQDAKVTVRRSTVCKCETIEAKIIDPNSMLLQNLNTGAYFYADKDSIEYTSTRPNNGEKALILQFKNEKTQYTGTLSYLMTGITWKPSYDLLLTGNNECKLRSYANIKNDQQREYIVDNTNLLGGDVQLATTSNVESLHGFDASRAPVNMKPIQMIGEQQGVYSYSLKDKYTLRPLSSVRLPFIDIVAKYRFYYKALTNIVSGNYQGVFQRMYDLTPDHFMPAGIITIHENQVLVGQSNLPDVPKNYTQTIGVGQDNDIRYLVKGNLTSKTDANATIQLETYEFDVQVMNLKDKNVEVELVIQGGVQMILDSTTCKSAKVNGNQLNLPSHLEKGESRMCKINITVRLT